MEFEKDICPLFKEIDILGEKVYGHFSIVIYCLYIVIELFEFSNSQKLHVLFVYLFLCSEQNILSINSLNSYF